VRCAAPPATAPHPRWNLLAAAVLILSLVHGLAGARWLPQALGTVSAVPLQTLQLDTDWAWFQRSALENDGWLLTIGTLADGSKMDVSRTDFRGPDVSKLPHAVLAADGLRWLAYRERLWRDPSTGAQAQYARYLCERWNAAHGGDAGKRLQQIAFVYLLERTPPPPAASGLIEQVLLGTVDCR
jgi:hypothetical protein